MASEWAPQETSKYQDHVIAHVLGTTVLGYFIADEAAHLLLDVGLIWTIYVDIEMGLLPQSVAIGELPLDAAAKDELHADAALLLDGREAVQLKRMRPAPVECLIVEVTCYAQAEQRRLLLHGEESNLAIETSLADHELRVAAEPLTRR